ncbi:hypothetical protein SRABI96_03599 [Peribacillus sp. Bi96]|uniref:hypothetical protein n=1 Tax=Peribacillus sp. Bi96 TaxID=2884273 RepID=UPI001E0E28DF|nr:hypothetical protein [Peribacillus sp. Bi96]CAH0267495.1 hypothetical protein SRABI96_03599 [Peribacillus sp. Bi96]
MEEACKAAFTAHATAVAARLQLHICLGIRFMNPPTSVFLISEASLNQLEEMFNFHSIPPSLCGMIVHPSKSLETADYK